MSESIQTTANVYRDDAQLRELHNLAVQLAPELSATLRLFRHEKEWPIRERVAAYVVIGRHIAIRNTLRQRGEWPGCWGTFIVFVDRPTVGLLLHEMRHQLPAELPIPDNIEPTSENVREEIEFLTRDREPESFCNTPWRGHEASWIRGVLHLHWRAWQQGVEVGLPELQVAGPDYGLSQPYKYMHAIGDEPERMAGATFEEIDASPFPEEFISLWRNDIRDFYLANPDLVKKQFKQFAQETEA